MERKMRNIRVIALASAAGAVLVGGIVAGVRAEPPADPVAKAAFAPCMGCHATDKGVNRVGPSLSGIVGRKVGSVAGFAYSPAMKAKGGAWTEAALDAYLANPRQAVPGTHMSYPGQKDPARRAALIAYLKSLK